MTRELVLIHGRSQEHKDASALKAQWLSAFAAGLGKSGLALPIPESSVRFPFYGDALYDLVQGKPAGAAADVILRGSDSDEAARRFARAVIEEIRGSIGVTDDDITAALAPEVIERGPENWEWVEAILRVIDDKLPGASGASIALVTNDVYQYLKNSAIRQRIEDGIVKALSPGVETVVVAHSLGTVVAYNLLRREGHLRGWKVPLLMTVGSPLAISEIRKTLRAFQPTQCPECVAEWFNARDAVDVVALYPLDPPHFPVDPPIPEIQNKSDVKNSTPNHHGIVGYLDDQEVARRIYDGLAS